MTLADEYLTALREEDLDRLLRLFAANAEVHSPLYGVLTPRELYSRLFDESSSATPTLRRVFTDGDTGVAFWFDYEWTLEGGATAKTYAVNVAELGADGLIEKLYIVYDTAELGDEFRGQATR